MAQLKISDLSVGDWVQDKEGSTTAKVLGIEQWADDYYLNVRVNGVDVGNVLAEGAFPIPITPEILEKNGFEVYDDAARLELDRPHSLWLFKEKEGWDLHLPSGEQHINLRIEHIHQLQHVLRLAGVEKEIEL